jgi:hypothetical protein
MTSQQLVDNMRQLSARMASAAPPPTPIPLQQDPIKLFQETISASPQLAPTEPKPLQTLEKPPPLESSPKLIEALQAPEKQKSQKTQEIEKSQKLQKPQEIEQPEEKPEKEKPEKEKPEQLEEKQGKQEIQKSEEKPEIQQLEEKQEKEKLEEKPEKEQLEEKQEIQKSEEKQEKEKSEEKQEVEKSEEKPEVQKSEEKQEKSFKIVENSPLKEFDPSKLVWKPVEKQEEEIEEEYIEPKLRPLKRWKVDNKISTSWAIFEILSIGNIRQGVREYEVRCLSSLTAHIKADQQYTLINTHLTNYFRLWWDLYYNHKMTDYVAKPCVELIYRDGSRLLIIESNKQTLLVDEITKFAKFSEQDWYRLYMSIKKVIDQWHKLQITHNQITPSSIVIRNNYINLTQFELSCQPLSANCNEKPQQLTRVAIKAKCGDSAFQPDPEGCLEAHQQIDYWQLVNTLYNLWRMRNHQSPLTYLSPSELRIRINQVVDWSNIMKQELTSLIQIE